MIEEPPERSQVARRLRLADPGALRESLEQTNAVGACQGIRQGFVPHAIDLLSVPERGDHVEHVDAIFLG